MRNEEHLNKRAFLFGRLVLQEECENSIQIDSCRY